MLTKLEVAAYATEMKLRPAADRVIKLGCGCLVWTAHWRPATRDEFVKDGLGWFFTVVKARTARFCSHSSQVLRFLPQELTKVMIDGTREYEAAAPESGASFLPSARAAPG